MKLSALIKGREAVVLFGLIGYIVIIGFINSSFIDASNLVRIANSALILVLLAVGSSVVIITRNIDISVGSILALTAIIGALFLRDGMPIPLVMILVMIIGAVLGVLNGIGVAYLGVPSIVMTVGTLGIYRGLSFVITGGHSVENIPAQYKQLGSMSWLGVPILVWVVAVIVIVTIILMARTVTGRHIYATGDNVRGAHLIGVRTKPIVVLAYAISGLFGGMAALIFIAQIGSVSNQAGAGIEMRAIAAAVIGGVALTGGVGSVWGATLGALFLTTITSSLTFAGIPGFWADTVIGAILLIALFTDARVRESIEKRRKAMRYRPQSPPREQEKAEATAGGAA